MLRVSLRYLEEVLYKYLTTLHYLLISSC